MVGSILSVSAFRITMNRNAAMENYGRGVQLYVVLHGLCIFFHEIMHLSRGGCIVSAPPAPKDTHDNVSIRCRPMSPFCA